jgi:hypothetical protein
VSVNITPSQIPVSDLNILGMTVNDIDDLRGFLSRAKEGIYAFYNSLG